MEKVPTLKVVQPLPAAYHHVNAPPRFSFGVGVQGSEALIFYV